MIELIDGRVLLYGPYWNANGFEVAVAAVITPEVDWAAYIGGNNCDDRKRAMRWTALHGCKLDEALARYFFPGIVLKYRV
jgi:hypothetical protein